VIEATLVLAVAKAATLVFGGLVTLMSFRAYRRTGSPALRALMVGIGLVTTGAILGGLLHQFVGLPLETSVSVQSIFTAIGFAVLSYSMYADSGTEPLSSEQPGTVQREN
jgi:branched-subunit amino acid ABC-type transport system permease component